MSDQIFVGDTGSEFRVTITDDDVAVDLSSATTLELIFRKPDGTILTVTASLYSDGTDGIIFYNTVEDDLDQSGIYKLEAYIEIDGNTFYSSIGSFKVLCPLG